MDAVMRPNKDPGWREPGLLLLAGWVGTLLSGSNSAPWGPDRFFPSPPAQIGT